VQVAGPVADHESVALSPGETVDGLATIVTADCAGFGCAGAVGTPGVVCAGACDALPDDWLPKSVAASDPIMPPNALGAAPLAAPLLL
jgi:hypothetical protein